MQKSAKQGKQTMADPQQPKPAQPTSKPVNGTPNKEATPVQDQLTESEIEALCDPTKRYIVIDTQNFTHLLVGVLQMSSREIRQILIRRAKEDSATLES